MDIDSRMFVTQIGPDGGRELPQQALHLLISFLGRSRQLERDLRAEMERMGIEIPDGPFYVAIFEADEACFTAEEPLLHHQQRREATSRLSEELCTAFAPEVGGFLFLAMGYLVGILFSASDAPQRLCAAVQQKWLSSGYGCFSSSFSRHYNNLSQVTMAWEEVFNRQRSRLFFADQPEMLDGESLKNDREYLWSSRFASVDLQMQQLAQRICGAILADQMERGHTLMDEAVDLMLDEGIHAAHFVETQMISALFSARLSNELKLAGILQPEYEADHAMAQQLLDCHDDQEFRKTAHSCLDDYVQHYQKRQMERSGRQMAALRKYLEENAFDQQAGLGMAARHFGVHPATLATGFRKEYGESVGDFINRVRVQQAKALLQEGGVTVQAVSEQVGFCSGTTMYRAFIRYEGRSPRSFKRQKSPDQSDS